MIGAIDTAAKPLFAQMEIDIAEQRHERLQDILALLKEIDKSLEGDEKNKRRIGVANEYLQKVLKSTKPKPRPKPIGTFFRMTPELPGSDFLKEAFLIVRRLVPKVTNEKHKIMLGHIFGNLRKLVQKKCFILDNETPKHEENSSVYDQAKRALSTLESINEELLFDGGKENGSYLQATRTLKALMTKIEKERALRRERTRIMRRYSYSRSRSRVRRYRTIRSRSRSSDRPRYRSRSHERRIYRSPPRRVRVSRRSRSRSFY